MLFCLRCFLWCPCMAINNVSVQTPGQVFGSLITRAKPAKPACIETWVLRVAGWLSFILC